MYSSIECIGESLEGNRKIVNKYLSDPSDPKKVHTHKVRIAIKKINAICQLLQFLIPGNSACSICHERTRKIFKALGKLRDLQHNDSYFRTCHLQRAPQKAYDKFYAIKKHKLTKKFHKALHHFNLDSFNKSVKKVQGLGQSMADKEILPRVKQFMLKKMKKADTLLLLKKFKNPEKIHEIRKLLKLLKYIHSLFDFNISPKKDFASRLKKMETIIGTWHDRFVLIQFIQKLIEKNQESKPAVLKPFYMIAERLSVKNKDKLIFQNIKQLLR